MKVELRQNLSIYEHFNNYNIKMSDNISNNKRVAKNTILLYLRMILLLFVSLYTSRVVLATLGFENYGIYNVVGAIVTMFSFVNMSLANSTSRFITYSLGKKDIKYSRLIFNSSFIVHIMIALVIAILSETIGLWFLYNKMVIPESRINAAFWVFQFSVVASIASILYVPFNAMIIAYEKMSAFAYISIFEAFLKLIIVYFIVVLPYDKLILYSFFYFCVNTTSILIYHNYCKKHFVEVKFEKIRDFSVLKEILKFAGWSMIGNLAYVGYTQGINILLNLFFGPIINAARGIAAQLQSAVMGFVTNFQIAVNPQITKSYAQEDYNRLHDLIYSSSKFSFFLLFCIVLPISIESKTILNLWLVDVPNYTIQFFVLTLFARLVDTLSNPIGIANNATGKIRNYQICEGGFLLLIIPIGYLVLKNGADAISVFWVQLIIMYLVQIIRLFLVCHKIKMSIKTYCKKVFLRIIPVVIFSSIIPLYLFFYLDNSLVKSFFIILISVMSVLFFSYLLGLENKEKKFINERAFNLIKRFRTN